MRDGDLIRQAQADLATVSAVLAHVPHDRATLALWADPSCGTAGPEGSTRRPPGSRDGSQPGAFSKEHATARRWKARYDAAFSLLHDAAAELTMLNKMLAPTIGDPTTPRPIGCPNCARATTTGIDGRTLLLWSRPYDARTKLCRWCYDFLQDWGVRPTAELARLHHAEHAKITTRLILDRHPELADRARELRRRAS